jgi:hypothetical protein
MIWYLVLKLVYFVILIKIFWVSLFKEGFNICYFPIIITCLYFFNLSSIFFNVLFFWVDLSTLYIFLLWFTFFVWVFIVNCFYTLFEILFLHFNSIYLTVLSQKRQITIQFMTQNLFQAKFNRHNFCWLNFWIEIFVFIYLDLAGLACE